MHGPGPPHHNGVYFSTVALEGRLAKLGPEGRKAMEEVGRFQKMVTEYRDALRKTAEMKRGQETKSARLL